MRWSCTLVIFEKSPTWSLNSGSLINSYCSLCLTVFPWKYLYPYHLGSKSSDVGVVIIPNTESLVLRDNITRGVTYSTFLISCHVLKFLILDINNENIFFNKKKTIFSAIAFTSVYLFLNEYLNFLKYDN